jgi:hypothetical protein
MTTTSTSYVPTGVAVDVVVPPSGNLLVAASATSEDDGMVTLMRDGTLNLGLANCDAGPLPIDLSLFTVTSTVPTPMAWGTPAAMGILGCGTLGSPGPVYIHTASGPAHLELYYLLQDCGCTPDVTLTNLGLWVTPLP